MKTRFNFLRIFALITFICCSFLGTSQMAFQNKTALPIKVSYAYFVETPKYTGWITKGWYGLKPGDKVTVIDQPLDNEYYYYYASSTDTSIEFKGDILLKVGDDSFRIEDANSGVNLKSDNHRFFRQIDTEEKKNFVIVLHENYVEEK